MPAPREYNFPRYLAAKKSVDDRALNLRVWETLAAALPPSSPEKPLRLLEIGAGIGSMLERMLEWGALDYAEYTALDSLPENIAAARPRLLDWARRHAWQASQSGDEFLLQRQGQRIVVHFLVADVFDFIPRRAGRTWDVLIAHAFLDLLDISTALPQLFSLLAPGGLFYFTLNFDGLTLFEPLIDPALDAQIEALYHRSMDERLTAGRPSGDSRSGRRLFAHLPAAGAHILEAGASDWVVFPRSGSYPADEAYFLHFILHFVETTLTAHPELDASRFAAWLARRRQQIETGELVYIAHQLDFAGKI